MSDQPRDQVPPSEPELSWPDAVEAADGPNPRSGVQSDGSWAPAFPGQRPPLDGNVDGFDTRFQPGHDLSTTHGGFSLALLDADVEALSVELRDGMAGIAHPRFEYAVQAVAAAGVLWRRAFNALVSLEEGMASERLEKEEGRRWRRWIEGLAALGLRPDAASKMGLQASLNDAARRRALLDRYRPGDVVDGEATDEGEAAA